ncbi:unnamed protein product [Pocillopora meandrina]|uniref:C-type lectin domain-containing protein n=1 Tax=Pocillopora meandrina TaxID=46732 RepID=A0AAU9XFR2_9CNID|nr:unnamed protein product [Pocillopora meandrina]
MMKYIKDKVDYIAERSTDQRGSACPDGWVRHGNSCFLIIDTPTLEWKDARRNCQRFGGDLAKITSSAENQFIFGLLLKQKKVTLFGVWLGLHRKADNKFYWADDTLLTGYNAWFTGEPNSLSEKCGHMWGLVSRKGRWNDITCTTDISRHTKDAPVILCH